MNRRFIPALSYHWLTPLYDTLLRWTMRDAVFKRRLVRQANIQNGHRVLDVGCGTATLTILVKRRYPSAEVVGLDPDATILEIARKNAQRNGVVITLIRGSATVLPYPDQTFDRVLSSLVFHHLARDQKHSAFQETFRVLKPGGQLHLADFGKPHNGLMWAISLIMRHIEQTADNFDGLLPQMLRDAGFVDIEEPVHYSRPFGTIALYCAGKPG